MSRDTRNNISDFIGRLTSYGLLHPHQYVISFAGSGFDASLQGSSIGAVQMNELLSDACESISFPGTSVASKETRIHGPLREIPYERLYTGDIQVTFRLDTNATIRKMFLDWQDFIINPKTHNLEYYDNYISSLEITQLSSNGNPIMTSRISEVYPKQVNELALGYADQNNYHKQSVSLGFKSFETTFTTEEAGQLQNFIGRSVETVNQIGSSVRDTFNNFLGGFGGG